MRTLADSECVKRHAGTIQSPREDVGPVPDKIGKISNNKKPGAMAAARAGRETGNSPNVPVSKPYRRIRYMVPATGFGTGERETHPPVLHGNNANIRPVDTPRHRTEFCAQLMVRGLPGHQCFYGLRAQSAPLAAAHRAHLPRVSLGLPFAASAA